MVQFETHQLRVFESALFRTTSTLFYNEDLIFLVDPTWLPGEIQKIQSFIKSIDQGQQRYLLFTHSDYDHILGWKAFPGFRTIASKAFVDHPDKDIVIQQIHQFDQQYYIQRDYSIAYPQINVVIEKDDQELVVGGTRIRFYLLPGHNADGIGGYISTAGLWVVGDYLSNIEFPYVYHSFVAYRESLEKMETLISQQSFDLLVPGHGDCAFSLEEVELRIRESRQYLDDLDSAMKSGQDFDLVSLWNRYDFPLGMQSFHEGNMKLWKRERR